MCAINGFNFRDKGLILKMNKITAHRGPDGTGVFVDENISLGHNRLSIIDLSKQAGQPMKSYDGKQVIVFNGEIYNFKDLKKGLNDYPFKTNSDTEVILAAYRKWGYKCLEKFNGIFAFAIWDNFKRELFLARDHVGVKPLYYFWDGKRFIFASEIKAILEHNIVRKLNIKAFNHYLKVLYVPEPMTMFQGIFKLPPASFAVLKNNKLIIKKYWEPEKKEDFLKNKREVILQLKELVSKSVKRQLISDRPLGIYLSGGIDSSVVLNIVSKIKSDIDTFSVGFDLSKEEEKGKFNTDLELARKTAEFYKTNHHEILISSNDVISEFENVVWHMDEPISNPTAIARMKLAKFTKQKVDVVLSGDGGDELFGGYPRYRLSLIADQYQKFIPRFVGKILGEINNKLNKLNTPPGIKRFDLFMFQNNKILSRVIKEDYFDPKSSENFFWQKYFIGKSCYKNFEELFMEIDRKSWLVDESLVQSDKMSMASAVEQRVPLLDKEVVEFANSIPSRYKVSVFDTKIILKEAFKNQLPKFLFNKSKRGWISPGAKWLRRLRVYKMAKEILSGDYYNETTPLFKWTNIKRILDNHYLRREYNLIVIWMLLTFQVWAKKYKVKI